jgi:hypothetical protein
MFNENLVTVIKQAEESKVVVDIFLLVVVFLILWWGFRRRPVVFAILFVTFAIVYSMNEVMTSQIITAISSENVIREVVITNKNESPFKLSSRDKMILLGGAAFSGVIQIRNILEGNREYTLTKRMSTSAVMNLYENVVYRSRLSTTLPEKVIFICQHGCEMMDVLSFFAFIPEGYKLTALNDITGGGNVSKLTASLFHRLFAKNLYGAHVFNRADKNTLKTQVSDFVDIMQSPGRRVFCIWPSGNFWNDRFENGVESFKLGTFYMSGYTKIPICIITQRLSTDRKRLIIEQSDVIYPPNIARDNISYIQFYEKEGNKPIIDEYRLRVENLYRSIDNRLVSELTKE